MNRAGILFSLGLVAAFYGTVYFVTLALVDLAGWGFWLAFAVGVAAGFGVILGAIGLGVWATIGTPERQARAFKKFLERSGNDLQARPRPTIVRGTQSGEPTREGAAENGRKQE